MNQCLAVAFNDETGVVTLEFARDKSVVTLRLPYENASEMCRRMNEVMPENWSSAHDPVRSLENILMPYIRQPCTKALAEQIIADVVVWAKQYGVDLPTEDALKQR